MKMFMKKFVDKFISLECCDLEEHGFVLWSSLGNNRLIN